MSTDHNFIRPPRSLEDASPTERELLTRFGINPDADAGILSAFRAGVEVASSWRPAYHEDDEYEE